MSLGKSLQDYQPAKSTLAWTAVGASVLTMVLGFTFGGWVMGGTAAKMAAEASANAHTQLAARVCAANFAATATARDQQAELIALSSFRQRSFVQGQPWALMPGETSVSGPVADLCAKQVAALDPETFAVLEEAAVILPAPEVDPG